MAAYRTATTGMVLEEIPFGPTNTKLLCDISTGRPRPVVPTTWRRRVFDAIHNLSHPSIRATHTLIASKFVWHALGKQVGLWARTCIPCQAAKVQRHTRAPLSTFKVLHHHFNHIHIDLVGPLPPPQGYTYLFAIVDCFTR